MKINVKLYDKCKYEKDAKIIADANLTDIASLEVKEIPESEETDAEGIDDYNEYLILTYEDGGTSTFRNSYVDIFRIDR